MSVPAIALVVLAFGLVLGLACERWPSHGVLLAGSTWLVALIVSELAAPLVLWYGVAAAALVVAGAAAEPVGWVAVGALVLGMGRLVRLAGVHKHSAEVLDCALESLGPHLTPRGMPRIYRWLPGLMLWRVGVRHNRRVIYMRRRRWRLRLDVYRPSSAPRAGERRPAIVYVHGGGWIGGSRYQQGILLLNHLAAHGWVGFNVDYRLSPWAAWPAQIIDVKAAIAWVREHADQYAIDPSFIAISGGSAGGHLSALAALTASDPTFQPGFEHADTSVQAAVPQYGVYDLTDGRSPLSAWTLRWVVEVMMFRMRRDHDSTPFRRASPAYRVHPGAPPFFILHGERDSLIDAKEARRFARQLRTVSQSEVIYAELPGAQHAFDVLPSLRSARTVEAVERFLSTMLNRHRAKETPPPKPPAEQRPAGPHLGTL